jgi:16S rRNA (cytidine1402-2'-O)-methyltransferase
MSKFYVVATPIGNLGDISLRALETLKSVDTILCEDTRQTKKLLQRYEINTKTLSYSSDEISSFQTKKLETILNLLKEEKDVALVSDAGTPGISDPGTVLISKIREYFREDKVRPKVEPCPQRVQVIPIPGPSALITALSACGLPIHEFTFLGFLPHKKGRETLFKEIAQSKRAMVFYESPHRILKTLESLQKFCPQKKVCMARELTKIYEEFKIDFPQEISKYLLENPEKQAGEFTLVVY